MTTMRQQLLLAEQKAKMLFEQVEKRDLIVPGKTESALIDDVVKVAHDLFSVENYWHKKIVRAGINTMQPYSGNPPDIQIQQDDLVIVDFGPVFSGWEADYARTYVMGASPVKLKMKQDVEAAWKEANAWYGGKTKLTGSEFFQYLTALARRYGYTYGGEIGGHIVGPYPHEQLGAGNLGLDIHPDNHQDMFLKDPQGNDRNWILEMHFVDRKNNIGGYMEQLLMSV